MDHSHPSVCEILYRFLIILSKIYSNYIAGKCLSCPFLNFLDPPPGPRLSLDDIIANTKENIHVIIMAFLSLTHCHLSYKCPSWVGVRRDSCICRLVPGLQNSSFWCHHATFLPTNGCWKSNHIPFPQLTNKNSAPIFWKVFAPRWLLQSQLCFYRCSICEWQNNQDHLVKTGH